RRRDQASKDHAERHESHGDARDPTDGSDRQGGPRDDGGDHRENDQADDVVDNGGTDNDASFVAVEPSEIERTRAVIPTDVAQSAAPQTSAGICVNPSALAAK